MHLLSSFHYLLKKYTISHVPCQSSSGHFYQTKYWECFYFLYCSIHFFIPWAYARWCPMPPWQLVFTRNGPAPWGWVFACLSDTILWCHPSTLCSVFLSCLVHLWFQTPRSSPTGCHPSDRCAQIIWVSSPWSFASHYFWCPAFVLCLHSLFSVATVCGEFFCNISFQMLSTMSQRPGVTCI